MSIHSTVLETPEKAHDKREPVVLFDKKESQSQGCEDEHDSTVAKTGGSAPSFVYNLANQLAAQHFSCSQGDHGEHGVFIFKV